MGDFVEARRDGDIRYVHARIVSVNMNSTYDVEYTDTKRIERSVNAKLIRPASNLSHTSTPVTPGARRLNESKDYSVLKEGSQVDADYRGKGKYFSGVISRVRVNGTFDVDYDDGEKETGVSRDLIKARVGSATSSDIKEGTKIEANYKGKGKWFGGVVDKVRIDGTFDVAYDDGEFEERVDESNVRAKGGESRFQSDESKHV